MILERLKRLSLLWRILLSTSIAITLLLGIAGWLVQRYVVRVTEQSIEQEIRASLQAYQSLWHMRANSLAAVSSILSAMSDVRAAFMTGDQATIRDTAGELWSRVSQEDAVFLVVAPDGKTIASLGGAGNALAPSAFVLPSGVLSRFPSQVSGFYSQSSELYYLILTPVYVQGGHEPVLLNILVAGFEVNAKLVNGLKQLTQGSDFVFRSGAKVIASTLGAGSLEEKSGEGGVHRLKVNDMSYAALDTPLFDLSEKRIGELHVLRSFAPADQRLAELQRNVFVIWAIAVLAGLWLTYLLAKRIVEPVRQLDQAAAEISRGNYDIRLPVNRQDELGRLAATFNTMSSSIQAAREELIRQERISTIGHISSSIVHDLRNPLAAIYGGAEMLVDSDLPPQQAKRLATNIYRASRRIQELLQDLLNISRGKTDATESCRLIDLVTAAHEVLAPAADAQAVEVRIAIPEDVELFVERARMERVFLNLMNNAIEAMPDGGKLSVEGKRNSSGVLVTVDDTGIGLSEETRAQLFQPFASAGKKNGLGLGLALARQTLLDHGGDLWLADKKGPGARFCLRFLLHSEKNIKATSMVL